MDDLVFRIDGEMRDHNPNATMSLRLCQNCVGALGQCMTCGSWSQERQRVRELVRSLASRLFILEPDAATQLAERVQQRCHVLGYTVPGLQVTRARIIRLASDGVPEAQAFEQLVADQERRRPRN